MEPRIFRKYENNKWVVTPMCDLKVGDVITAEDYFDQYYKVDKEIFLYEFTPGDLRNTIEVDGFTLTPDMKPFWKNLNPDAAHVATIQKEIEANGGQCCCVLKSKQNEDTLCPCKAYREQHTCICKLYVDEE